jgi:hypothetical protein
MSKSMLVLPRMPTVYVIVGDLTMWIEHDVECDDANLRSHMIADARQKINSEKQTSEVAETSEVERD